MVENQLLIGINGLIKDVKKVVSNAPQSSMLQNEMISVIKGFFYSNIINNFKNNLTEDNLKECNITKKDVNNINSEFKKIFQRSEATLEAGSNKGKIDSKVYKSFRNKLSSLSKNSFKLLLEVEKLCDIPSCEKAISKFKNEVKTLGKKIKISGPELKGGEVAMSIGYGDSEDEDDLQ